VRRLPLGDALRAALAALAAAAGGDEPLLVRVRAAGGPKLAASVTELATTGSLAARPAPASGSLAAVREVEEEEEEAGAVME
jgi:hypothetical protein